MFIGYEFELIKNKSDSARIEIREVYNDHSVVIANLPIVLVRIESYRSSECECTIVGAKA